MDPSRRSMQARWWLGQFALVVVSFMLYGGSDGVGVNYGMIASNLPSPDKVVSLCHTRNITRLRLFHPDATALSALRSTGIEIILGTLNEDLPQLATSPQFAATWVSTNVAPYSPAVRFRYICAGNEVIPGDLAGYVLPAMRNLDTAILAAGVSAIPVTTAVSGAVLAASYPPSQGAFSDAAASALKPIAAFLQSKQWPLLANVYPYFAYAADPVNVSLNYALSGGGSSAPVVKDNTTGLAYSTLLDAMVDATYAALERAGASGVEIVVSETGWPSGGGGEGATVGNASAYNNNLAARVLAGAGTPKRPGKPLETYLFAMFNEDQKPSGIEQHFGLYQPDMTEVYHVNFATNT